MKKKIVITVLICTIICVIICTCIFVIKNNKKTDMESENSDYEYLDVAGYYNLGTIVVVEYQDGKSRKEYRYSEGIGSMDELESPPTRDVVENINTNLGLTGDDRLSVDDVVNNEDKSLTGSDKVRKVHEEICNIREATKEAFLYEEYYDGIIPSELK